ncbi:hmg-CoA reductase [Aspergillus luchuensis]|uniref:Hmg-CoA reductase n=1 Tax=Aspergillus kawachii TaxID=1069201 RepID=A0A146FAY2_ASPKA|nr:hmg-CoA reductase [Aspergillus luchuensis]
MSHTLLQGFCAVRSTMGLLLRMLSTAGDADQRPTVRSIAGMRGTRHVEWILPVGAQARRLLDSRAIGLTTFKREMNLRQANVQAELNATPQ